MIRSAGWLVLAWLLKVGSASVGLATDGWCPYGRVNRPRSSGASSLASVGSATGRTPTYGDYGWIT